MARPRGNDWLCDELLGLHYQGVEHVVSLLEFAEIHELGLQVEESICKRMAIDFTNYPIPDVQTPKDLKEYINVVKGIAQKVHASEKVVIHCRMGIGRSSMVVAGVLVTLGIDSKLVFSMISQARGLTVPDTEEQKQWFLDIAHQLI